MEARNSAQQAPFFTGDEFYLKEWPEVEGYSFKEVLVSFPRATPIGVKERATDTVVLNPEDDYVIQPGTRSTALRGGGWCTCSSGIAGRTDVRSQGLIASLRSRLEYDNYISFPDGSESLI